MANYDDINKLCDEMIAKQKLLADKILKVMNEETAKAMEDADKKFGEEQQKMIRSIFAEAVTSFYDDYTPRGYKRRGNKDTKTGGLYEVLDLRTDPETGKVVNGENGDYTDFFDETRMHADRHGNYSWTDNGGFESLYDLTFMHGWHGGAADSSDGTHPHPGTPYYRKPPKFAEWGRKARQMKPSPYQVFKTELISAEGGAIYQVFKSISDEYNAKAMKIVNDKTPQLYKEVYGN